MMFNSQLMILPGEFHEPSISKNLKAQYAHKLFIAILIENTNASWYICADIDC